MCHLAELVDDLLLPDSPTHVVCWQLLLLADKSHVQKRVQNELDASFGPLGGALDSIHSIRENARSNLTFSKATFWKELIQTSLITVVYGSKPFRAMVAESFLPVITKAPFLWPLSFTRPIFRRWERVFCFLTIVLSFELRYIVRVQFCRSDHFYENR